MFNALVAEKGELKEQVEKLERQLSLSRANQKELESVKQRLETAMQSQWKRYSEMKVELTEANATVTALRNALPRRISAAPSDI
jgi:peptidoglycan hydrolase CwlO-like protein